MFIDIAKIKIVSGKGGDGKVGFHREKYVAAGGPDGGDGGRGGSVIFKVDDNLSTLLDFRYKKKYVAAPGEPGGGKRCKGKDGDGPRYIRVPRGTIIRDQKTGQVMKDMSITSRMSRQRAATAAGATRILRRLRAKLRALQSPAHPVKHSSFSLNSSCSLMWAL